MAISISLQYGVPLETYVSKFTNMKFEPAGLTDDPDVRMSQSIMDYIFRRLALDYLSFDDRAALGIYSADERQRQLETGSYEPIVEETGSAAELLEEPDNVGRGSSADGSGGRVASASERIETPVDAEVVETKSAMEPAPSGVHTSAELFEKLTGTAVDSPLCMTCGTKMRPAGSCYVCEGCGSTSGCS
jgi:ribonucleoside-diphosphate reductase alpha chain